jgi:hypothetical protein
MYKLPFMFLAVMVVLNALASRKPSVQGMINIETCQERHTLTGKIISR